MPQVKIHNVIIKRRNELMLILSTNDVDKFESFACDILNAYEDANVKVKHHIKTEKYVETIFIEIP